MIDPRSNALSVSTVAVGWSGYFVSLAHDAGIDVPQALAGPPGRDAAGVPGGDHIGHALEIPWEAHLPRQDIGGAAGPDGEWGRAANQGLHRLVDGAVAAVHHDQVGAGCERVTGEARGVPWRRGRPSLHAEAAALE